MREDTALEAVSARRFAALLDPARAAAFAASAAYAPLDARGAPESAAPLGAGHARELGEAMRALGLMCDEMFPPHETQEVHAELADLHASLRRGDIVSGERLAQLAELRLHVERLWARSPGACAPLTQLDYTRTMLQVDLALVRLRVQVLRWKLPREL
jgi:hypothetical protein